MYGGITTESYGSVIIIWLRTRKYWIADRDLDVLVCRVEALQIPFVGGLTMIGVLFNVEL